MKDIYKYFNDIEVDIDKINSIDVELDDITKKRIKNNIKSSIKVGKSKHLSKVGIVVAAVSLVILVSAIIPHTAFADNVPVIDTLFKKFGLGYGGDFEDYTQVIDEVKKDKGYEVKIDEVVMDEFSFKFIYTIKCQENVSNIIKQEGNPFPHTPSKSIKLNNKDFVGGAGGTYRLIDDYTVQVSEDYDINELDLPKNFNIEIDFKEINNTKGDWKFNFHVSKEKIFKDIKNYSPNKQLIIQNNSGEEVELNFEKISFSPLSIAVFIKTNNEFEYGNLIFKDENGNIINYKSSSLDIHNGLFGYNAKALYKFEPMQNIPSKILVEYKNTDTTKSNEIELIFK